MIWIESPTNPTLKVIDIREICKIAKNHNIISVVDNTFATPYLQTPSKLGADITVKFQFMNHIVEFCDKIYQWSH